MLYMYQINILYKTEQMFVFLLAKWVHTVYNKYKHTFGFAKEDGKMDYKRKIMELLGNIESEAFLKFLYNIIISFKKEWGY